MPHPPLRTPPRLAAYFGTLCCIAFVFIAAGSVLDIVLTMVSSPLSASLLLVGSIQSLALLLAAYGMIWLNGGVQELLLRLGQVRVVLLLVALVAVAIGVDTLD